MDKSTNEHLRDSETGELLPKLNLETGEVEIVYETVTKKPFKIPKMYMTDHNQDNTKPPKRIKMSPIIVFLLPTLFFVPIVSLYLGCVEVLMHLWAHKKNKSLINQGVYYQSPLHIITSEFCSCCKDESMKNKISRMQDKRKSRFMKNSAKYLKCV